jgi:hypothetical protein
MVGHLRSYLFPLKTPAVGLLGALIQHPNKVNDTAGLSTPEFYGTNEPGGIRGVADLPEIHRQAADGEQIKDLQNHLPAAQSGCGALLLRRSGSGGEARPVQLAHARLEPVCPEECQDKKSDGQADGEFAQGPARIEPLAGEVEQGDDAAGDLEMVTAEQEDMSDGAGEVGIIIGSEQVVDFGREHGGNGGDGEEDGAAEPDGGVQNPDESQHASHASTLGKRPFPAKPSLGNPQIPQIPQIVAD